MYACPLYTSKICFGKITKITNKLSFGNKIAVNTAYSFLFFAQFPPFKYKLTNNTL